MHWTWPASASTVSRNMPLLLRRAGRITLEAGNVVTLHRAGVAQLSATPWPGDRPALAAEMSSTFLTTRPTSCDAIGEVVVPD